MSNTDTVANGDVGIIVEMNKNYAPTSSMLKVDFGYEGAKLFTMLQMKIFKSYFGICYYNPQVSGF